MTALCFSLAIYHTQMKRGQKVAIGVFNSTGGRDSKRRVNSETNAAHKAEAPAFCGFFGGFFSKKPRPRHVTAAFKK